MKTHEWRWIRSALLSVVTLTVTLTKEANGAVMFPFSRHCDHVVFVFVFHSLSFLEKKKNLHSGQGGSQTIKWSVLSHSSRVFVPISTGTYDAQGQFGVSQAPKTMQSPAAAGKYFHLASGGVAPSCDRPLLVVDLHLQRHIKAVVTARSLRSIELYCLLIEQFALARETRRSGAHKSARGCILPHVKVIRWHQLNRQLIESLCHKAAAPCSLMICHSDSV